MRKPYLVAYNRAEIQEMLHLRHDSYRYYGAPRAETAPDDDMPRSKSNPALAGGVIAELSDINRAWKWGVNGGLTPRQGQVLVLVYKHGMNHTVAAAFLGISRSRVSHHHDEAVGRLLQFLNGPHWAGEDSDG